MKINKPKWLLYHHFGGTISDPYFDSSKETLEQIDDYHKSLRFYLSSLGYRVGYHWLIFPDGLVIQTRAKTDEGCHCVGRNTDSLSIGLVGNFSRPTWKINHLPTDAQKKSFAELGIEICKEFDIPLSKVVGHNFFKNTQCAGLNLPENWGRNLIGAEMEDDDEIKIELLKKQIGILQKLIALYTKILRLFSKVVFKGDKEDN